MREDEPFLVGLGAREAFQLGLYTGCIAAQLFPTEGSARIRAAQCIAFYVAGAARKAGRPIGDWLADMDGMLPEGLRQHLEAHHACVAVQDGPPADPGARVH